MHRLLLLICLIVTTALSVSTGAAEPAAKKNVIVYFYHDMAPYVIAPKRRIGLYYDFVRMLNQSQERWHFQAEFLPRIRIEYMLKHDLLPGILLGVNPLWFKDPEKTRFFWSPAIMQDRDIIVSRAEQPVAYDSIPSLYGKTIAGILGYYYHGISEAVAKGQITRSDNDDMSSVLNQVLHQQADAGIVGQAFFNYTTQLNVFKKLLFVASKPHDTYSRHLLIPQRYPELKEPITRWVEALNQDSYWIEHRQKVLTGHYRYPP